MVNSTKAHTQYYSKSGELLVGVTTALSILAKPSIVNWAYECGRRGEDYRKVRDKAGDVGTITHLMITSELQNVVPELKEYSQADIDSATLCLNSFHEWRKSHTLEIIHVEKPLVSEKYLYGGTPDYIGLVNGELELMDFKTSGGIWNDYFYQIAAYHNLAIENGYQHLKRARILRFSKGDNVEFEDRLITSFQYEFELFLHCLSIYRLLKLMKRSL